MHTVTCPKCQNVLKVPKPVFDAKVRCAACKAVFVASSVPVASSAPVVVQPAVREVILVTGDGEELASAITEADMRVRTFRAAAPAVDVSSIDDVLAALSAETHEHVVIVERAEGGGFEVIPLD